MTPWTSVVAAGAPVSTVRLSLHVCSVLIQSQHIIIKCNSSMTRFT